MDGVVTDHFVPRLDLLQYLTSLVLRLPGFVYLDAGRRSDQVTAGLLAEHRAAQEAARHEPRLGRAGRRARRGLRCRQTHSLLRSGPGHCQHDRDQPRPSTARAAA
jgi:hypothetical protein